jgi:hypothetical protein
MKDGVRVYGVWVRGPLADHAGGFAGSLAAQGYTPGSAGLQLHLVAQLSRWLGAEGLDAAGLTELEAARFVAARRTRVRRLFRSRQALEPLMSYLTTLGILVAPVAVPAGPVEKSLSITGGICWWSAG